MHCAWLPGYSDEQEVVLQENEAHHIVHVLRASPGTEIRYTNGNGITGTAALIRVDKKQCVVQILSRDLHVRSGAYLHMGISILRNSDRMAFVLEKLTELGVTRITPLLTHHTERKHFNREKEMWHMIAAMKQSAQPFLPQLDEVVQFLHWCKADHQTAQKCIAHCRESTLPALAKTIEPARSVVMAIGPEGDFSAEEVEAALQNGFTACSLGDDVLRAETAGIAAAVIIKTVRTLYV